MSSDRPQVIVTGDDVYGHEIEEYLGVVRSPSIGQGLRGAFKSIIGGNVAVHEEACEAAGQDAFRRMAR